MPPGLSARDAAILRSVKKRAHYLDKGFSLCGIHFGWTFFIGLVPIAGDVTDAYLNYTLIVKKARKADLPDWLIAQMLFNNAVSAGVGFIPIIGDVLLAIYKANSRNAALLDEFLRIRGQQFLKMRETEGKGENSERARQGDLTAADIGQVKPGSGMTPSEIGEIGDDYTVASSTGVAPTHSKSGLFGIHTKERPGLFSASGPKGRFVEHMEPQETSM